ncbi:MAG TPA: hypothetical protein VFO55_13730 [Gemmatimonadaceae bacterium]|nr:hypothetical protein [Gemmatimonadaceae bacterium]
MPFTPFHFGPGLLLKAGVPRRMSFLAFATTQVAIDLESWHYLTANDPHVHRTLHTIGAATLAGVGIGCLVWILGAGVHALLGPRVAGMTIGTRLPVFESEVSMRGALTGGVLGGVTHSIFDAIVHGDVEPLLPLSRANPFLGLIEWNMMENACIVAGIAGLIAVLGNRRVWTTKR